MTIDNSKTPAKLSLMLLDDEPEIVRSLKRILRDQYKIVGFTDPAEALAHLQQNTIDMIMSDMRMPGMNGAEFLAKARQISPHSMRVLLTGYSEISDSVKAINEGGIHTYLSKPWDNEGLRVNLRQLAERYVLQQQKEGLSEQLEKQNEQLTTLNNTLEQKVTKRTAALQLTNSRLTEALAGHKAWFKDLLEMIAAMIGLRTGSDNGHLIRIAVQAKQLARQMGLDKVQCNQIYICALIHKIGLIGLKDDDICGGYGQNANYTEMGADILKRISRFKTLIPIIKSVNENYNGSGTPVHLKGEQIPLGARIIRVVNDFDYMVCCEQNGHRMSPANARNWLRDKSQRLYDEKVVAEYLDLLKRRPDDEFHDTEYCVGLEEIMPGMVLKRDLTMLNGNIMLKSGQALTNSMIDKIRRYEQQQNLKMGLFV